MTMQRNQQHCCCENVVRLIERADLRVARYQASHEFHDRQDCSPPRVPIILTHATSLAAALYSHGNSVRPSIRLSVTF